MSRQYSIKRYSWTRPGNLLGPRSWRLATPAIGAVHDDEQKYEPGKSQQYY
jgi:hypothetical protein